MFPLIKVSELLDSYVIIVDKGVAVLFAIACAALAPSVGWLANQPQPTPAWVTEDTP